MLSSMQTPEQIVFKQDCETVIHDALFLLGISAELILKKNLTAIPIAQELNIAEVDQFGGEHRLIPPATIAWKRLKLNAYQDGIVLEIVSAFRGIDEQTKIIQAMQALKIPLEKILTLSAPPGFSEHHTGCAIDINTPGCIPREETFELTDAFAWLTQHASAFGFSMSYARDNQVGFIFEPWHWLYREMT